jgi:hypothetical protein
LENKKAARESGRMPSTDETRASSYGSKSLSDRSNAQQRHAVRHTAAAQRQRQQHETPRRRAAMLLQLENDAGTRGMITI